MGGMEREEGRGIETEANLKDGKAVLESVRRDIPSM